MIAALLAAALSASAPAAPGVRVAQEGLPDQEIWQLDQLRVASGTDAKLLKQIEPDHSLEAVMVHLKKLGVPYERVRTRVLPARLPDKLREQILSLPPGEPFVLPETDFISISIIVGRQLPSDAVRYVPARAGLRHPGEA